MVTNPTISIRLEDTPEALTFEVMNQISTQVMEHKDESSGIGLTNVRRRLELLYPETHTLSITDENGVYRVLLTIKHV
jgi:sensor histidine kinase YesM